MAAYARSEVDVLSIGNEYLERRLDLQVGKPCLTISFLNRRTGRDYWRPGGREFSFSVDGRALDGRDLHLTRVNAPQSGDAEATISLTGEGLEVELVYRAYADYPVLEKWLVLTNRRNERITIADLDWEDVNLLVDSRATAEVWDDYFTRRNKAAIRTMDDCALLVNDAARHEGFIVATLAPGPLKRIEVYAERDRIAVGYNSDDETIFERTLAPGERLQTPSCFILPFANAVPQDVIEGDYARFVSDKLTVCDPGEVPTVTVNSWLPHEFGIDRALLLEQIDAAAEMGVDAYQVDAGWYDKLGDWNVDRDKFPNGLEEIVARVRSHGMKFGLWMAVATADETSEVYREHPEWLARARAGQPNRHPIAGAVTMCLASGFYDYILPKIDAVVERYGVDLLKLDLSSVRNLYEPGRYAGCFATNHGHASARESHARILERVLELARSLKQRHPHCLVDLSYELYGVMDGTDLALTRVADQNWFTNITSPNEVSLRREVYQRGRVTAPWTLNCAGALLDRPDAPRYGLFTGFTAHAVYWGDLAKIDRRTRAHYRRWFDWAKQQRQKSDFYRFYRASDVFPPPDGLSSRDFRHSIPVRRYGIAPLGIHPPAFEPATEQRGRFWDGVARVDERGEGPVFVFRPAASLESKFRLRMPCVCAGARYLVRDETEERDLGEFSAEALSEQGIEVEIAEPAGAKVIVLTRAEG